MNRTIGIVLTVATVLCCACPGFGLCIFGGLVSAGQPVSTTVNGVSSSQVLPVSYGIASLCLALILILIPIGVGFVTFRMQPKPVSAVASDFNGPIPPVS